MQTTSEVASLAAHSLVEEVLACQRQLAAEPKEGPPPGVESVAAQVVERKADALCDEAVAALAALTHLPLLEAEGAIGAGAAGKRMVRFAIPCDIRVYL